MNGSSQFAQAVVTGIFEDLDAVIKNKTGYSTDHEVLETLAQD